MRYPEYYEMEEPLYQQTDALVQLFLSRWQRMQQQQFLLSIWHCSSFRRSEERSTLFFTSNLKITHYKLEKDFNSEKHTFRDSDFFSVTLACRCLSINNKEIILNHHVFILRL